MVPISRAPSGRIRVWSEEREVVIPPHEPECPDGRSAQTQGRNQADVNETSRGYQSLPIFSNWWAGRISVPKVKGVYGRADGGVGLFSRSR